MEQRLVALALVVRSLSFVCCDMSCDDMLVWFVSFVCNFEFCDDVTWCVLPEGHTSETNMMRHTVGWNEGQTTRSRFRSVHTVFTTCLLLVYYAFLLVHDQLRNEQGNICCVQTLLVTA